MTVTLVPACASWGGPREEPFNTMISPGDIEAEESPLAALVTPVIEGG